MQDERGNAYAPDSRPEWLYVSAFCAVLTAWLAASPYLLAGLPSDILVLARGLVILLLLAAFGAVIVRRLNNMPLDVAPKYPASLLLALFLGIAAVGYSIFDGMRQSERADVERNLAAIGKLKTGQIAAWVQTNFDDIAVHMRNPVFSDALAHPRRAQQNAIDRLSSYVANHPYKAAALLDLNGIPVANAQVSTEALVHLKSSGLLAQLDQPRLVDFFDDRGKPALGILAPIFLNDTRRGALFFEIDPEHDLYPQIEQWPIPSLTAETYIARLEGSRIVYLSRLRHTNDPPLRISRPAGNMPPPSAAEGRQGIMEQLDYRNQEVLASQHPVPGTPWLTVSKMDLSETYAAIHRFALMTFVLVLILMSAAGLALWQWWQRIRACAHAERSAEQAQRERMFQEVVDASEDAILLIDIANNRFIECNGAAIRMMRAAGKQEFLYTHPWEISPEYQPDGQRSDEKSAEMNRLAEVRHFHRFEWTHLRADGAAFPVEVTLTPARMGGQALLHVIWRDLTETKKNEEARNRANRALEMLSSGNRALVRSMTEDKLLESMCRIATTVGGYRMAWVAYRNEDEAKSVRVAARAGFDDGYLDKVRISWGDDEYGQGPTGLSIRTGKPQVLRQPEAATNFAPWREEALKRGYHASAAIPLMQAGEPFGALMMYSGEGEAFDAHEMRLLEEMAEDLAFGIVTLREKLEHQRVEEEVEKSYSLLQAAFDSTADGFFITTLDGEIESYNHQFVDMFHLPAPVLERREARRVLEFLAHHTVNHAQFLHQAKEIAGHPDSDHEFILELKDGRKIERISKPQIAGGRVIGRVCNFRDITARISHENQLIHLANHDGLTGLPNRELLLRRLDQSIELARKTDARVGLLFIDLDRFKLINDSLGHDNGDRFLVEIAQRLPACIREQDIVARMGGDEFVVLMPDLPNDETASSIASRLLRAIGEPCMIAGNELYSMASIGIAIHPRDGEDAATLLKFADAAMYRAKEQGGNGIRFVTSEINDHSARHLDLTNKLRLALERNEFRVHYQPQLNVRENSIIGAEALLRWEQPELGMISPVEFIPIAEETGLIVDIGNWVIEKVCADIRAWKAAGLPATRIAVNLSARQFDRSDLPETIAGILETTGVLPQALELEITEGMVMQQPDRAIRMLNDLKAMGFAIAIDDFGTGYSSLGYLKRFPIDKLKIDRSFIKDISVNNDDAAITRAVIAMAHELRMKVVAEGVETGEQLVFLELYNCDVVQGYLTGRPMPATDFAATLNRQSLRQPD